MAIDWNMIAALAAVGTIVVGVTGALIRTVWGFSQSVDRMSEAVKAINQPIADQAAKYDKHDEKLQKHDEKLADHGERIACIETVHSVRHPEEIR